MESYEGTIRYRYVYTLFWQFHCKGLPYLDECCLTSSLDFGTNEIYLILAIVDT